MKHPKVIFFTGLPGSGKTFVARKLAAATGAVHISSDILRKEMHRQGQYRPEDKQQVYIEMKTRMVTAISQGHHVILDGTFYQAHLREELTAEASPHSSELYWIKTVCNEETTRKRVSKKRPDSEADFEVYKIVREAYEPLKGTHLTIHTDTTDIHSSLQKILKYCTFDLMNESDLRNIHIEGEAVQEVIETHISWLVLTKTRVFKCKKAVQFSFLDFSTLDQRKHYCERELELNRRLTTDMYQEVVPVRLSAGKLTIYQPEGPIVDYAVVMKRQDNQRQMHLLLEKGEVHPRDIIRLADKIAAFHVSAEVILTPFDPQQFAQTFNDIQSVSDFIQAEIGEEFAEIITASVRSSDRFIQTYTPQFQERVQNKWVRDAHGDLHSGNIFLPEEPVIFDCIEFNDDFRKIDLLNEIGFFCMDLDAYGRQDLSKVFVEEYQRFLPDVLTTEFDHLLFIYYKLFRANVRAKVMAMKAMQHAHEDHNASLQEVRQYLNLMKGYLEEL